MEVGVEDRVLVERLEMLCARERRVTAQLLWHLAEVDRRGLYRDCRYSSLFNYCVKGLRMSEGEAGLRIRVARTAGRYPMIYGYLERGELHLSAVSVLSPVLSSENCEVVLKRAVHRTKAEVEELVADLRPKAVCPDVIRTLPEARLAARVEKCKEDAMGQAGLFEQASAVVTAPSQRRAPDATCRVNGMWANSVPLGPSTVALIVTTD